MQNVFGAQHMAAGYATSRPAVHPQIIERIRQYIGPEAHLHRALDVGCGAGLSTRPLTSLARHCIGIDPAESMLKWSSRVAPGAQFIAGAGEALPVRSRSVDLMTAAGSLNYTDMSLSFREAARVLIPAGRLIVYDFAQGKNVRTSESLSTWFGEFARRYPPPARVAHVITPESLRQMRHGFTVEADDVFDVDLAMDSESYVNYVMTETNVAEAIAGGALEFEIRSWCRDSLADVFAGRSREVAFPAYIAYLVLL